MAGRAFLAFVCGAILGLIHISSAVDVEWLGRAAGSQAVPAPFKVIISILALSALFRLWHGAATSARAVLNGAIVGTAGGIGYYLVSLHWLGHAFLAPDETYSALALFGESGSLLLFFPWWTLAMGLAAAARGLVAGASPLASALLWALLMSIADTLLADLAYQIPLAPISAVLLDTPLDPVIAGFGALGANMALLAIAACGGAATLGQPLACLAGASLLISGAVALPEPMRLRQENKSIVAVIQPAGEQRIRPTFFDRASWMGDLEREIEAALDHKPAVIVLPELSIPFDPSLEEDTRDLDRLLDLAPDTTTILFGYYTAELRDGEIISQNRVAASRGGTHIKAYEKAHLVPFGEFIPPPFAQLGFSAMTGPSTGLTPGDRIDVWSLPGLPKFSVLICYEALLTGAVSRETNEAEWLVNPSSEVMLRNTIGPYLSLQYARMRSIETGKPMFRAASTGWSAIIDSDGSVLASIPREIPGSLAHELPDRRATLFSRFGYLPLYAAWAGCLVLAASLGRMTKPKLKGAALGQPLK